MYPCALIGMTTYRKLQGVYLCFLRQRCISLIKVPHLAVKL